MKNYFRYKKYHSTIFFLIVLLFNISQALKAQPANMARLSIQLLLNTNSGSSNTADGCMLFFADGFTKGIGMEDSRKLSNLDENLAINCGGTMLSMEGRPTLIDYDTIPLKIWQYRQNHYYLKFSATYFSPLNAAVLKDNYLHTDQVIDLSSTTLLNFSINADTLSASADRFCIVFMPAAALPVTFVNLSASKKMLISF
jgi:hypothetical protein